MAEVTIRVPDRLFATQASHFRPIIELDGLWRWNWSARKWYSIRVPGDG